VANQPDLNKRVLSLRILREDYRKLQKEAKAKKMGFNEYIRHLINEAIYHVALDEHDYQIITSERKHDARRQNSKRNL
jgi:hypothetical protein